MKFSHRSLANLLGVHPALVNVVRTALGYAQIDFSVTEGLRTLEEQERLYAQGRTIDGPIVTWTMESKHLPQKNGFSYAVDLHPYPIDYNNHKRYNELAKLMMKAADECGVTIEWGGNWKTKDLPHYQLARE